jgi:hypothetical protein
MNGSQLEHIYRRAGKFMRARGNNCRKTEMAGTSVALPGKGQPVAVDSPGNSHHLAVLNQLVGSGVKILWIL